MFEFIKRIYRTVLIVFYIYKTKWIFWRLGKQPDIFDSDIRIMLKELEDLEWEIHNKEHHEK